MSMYGSHNVPPHVAGAGGVGRHPGDLQDPYRSRVKSHPERLPRLDPVLHGPARDCRHLSAHQLQSFQEDGFLILERFFDAERIAPVLEEASRLEHDPAIRNREETVTEPASDAVRSIFRIHDLSHVFFQLARDPVLLDIVRFILNDDVYVHQSRLNYKPGFTGKEFFWHSDFETWHVEDGMPRMRALSVSVALTENFLFNGPLMLVPGSHKTFVSCVGATPDEHYKTSLRRQEYGVPDRKSLTALVETGGIVAPAGPPGSIVLFDCNVMHGSNSNITPLPRSNAFFVFNACSNSLVAPFGAAKPRPDFIASRDFTPLKPAA